MHCALLRSVAHLYLPDYGAMQIGSCNQSISTHALFTVQYKDAITYNHPGNIVSNYMPSHKIIDGSPDVINDSELS